MKDYSQYGESKILYELFEKIKVEKKFAVEFGASDGYWLSNIRMFMDIGWDGLQLEGISEPKNGVKNEFITKENINEIFSKYNVPKVFDLLSIDLDGNDFWIWKELNYEPNVVIIEYNSNFNVDESYSLIYNPTHNFYESGGFYSASAKAFNKLAIEKGYFLYKEVSFTNLIFVKNKFKNIVDEFDYKLIKPRFDHGGKDLSKFIEI